MSNHSVRLQGWNRMEFLQTKAKYKLDFSVKIGQLKRALQNQIHGLQLSGDACEWENSNFLQI